MKQTLLLSLLTFSFYGSAQMTQANEPAIGALNAMFLCDSFAVNYEATTGAGVTWDYTDLAGYNGTTQDVQCIDPSNTSYGSDFTSSTYAIKIGSNLTTYYSSTATDRSSQGFVYFAGSGLGDVIAKFDSDEELVATYPFALGSSLSDAFSGNIDYMAVFSTAADGVGYAEIDGTGTLLLSGNTLNNVLRYKIRDTSWATITMPINLGDIEFIRTQYEYYDYSVSNLPVLLHSSITVQPVGGSPISTQTLVLSYYQPTYNVGVNELEAVTFSVYPNPARNEVFVQGELSADATIDILDQGGRVLKTTSNATISIADLADGVYFVRVNDNGVSTSQRIIKQ
jgi:hypothetical protein